jgi:hypothetical protein
METVLKQLSKRAQLFILTNGDGARAAVFSTFHKASAIGTFQAANCRWFSAFGRFVETSPGRRRFEAAPGSVIELDREAAAAEIARIRSINRAV